MSVGHVVVLCALIGPYWLLSYIPDKLSCLFILYHVSNGPEVLRNTYVISGTWHARLISRLLDMGKGLNTLMSMVIYYPDHANYIDHIYHITANTVLHYAAMQTSRYGLESNQGTYVCQMFRWGIVYRLNHSLLLYVYICTDHTNPTTNRYTQTSHRSHQSYYQQIHTIITQITPILLPTDTHNHHTNPTNNIYTQSSGKLHQSYQQHLHTIITRTTPIILPTDTHNHHTDHTNHTNNIYTQSSHRSHQSY